MRVLLDEMLPRKLALELIGHEVSTVRREGWAALKNGEMLDAIGSSFDVFITMDRGMRHQQRIAGRSFGLVELHAQSTDISDLRPLVPAVLACLSSVKPGELIQVPREA